MELLTAAEMSVVNQALDDTFQAGAVVNAVWPLARTQAHPCE